MDTCCIEMLGQDVRDGVKAAGKGPIKVGVNADEKC